MTARPVAVVRATAMRWVLGGVIASLLVTVMAPCFLSSLRVYEWSPELDGYVLKEGYVHRKRDEGWASTRYGPYGFASVARLGGSDASTVMIWGDSYVEAHQVDDEQKTVCQVNNALSEQGLPQFRAVAVGRACWSVADYYFKIPQYEKLVDPVCHFIVLAEYGLNDLCPDGETFVSEPALQFVRRSLVDSRRSAVIAGLHRWGLSDMLLAPWKAVRTVLVSGRNIRFSLGPRKEADEPTAGSGCRLLASESEPNAVIESWSYALERLKARSSRPIVLVLVPEVPRLERGAVCLVDPQSEWRRRLARLCTAEGVGCIDMTATLVNDYRATGKFSRGFHNGKPDSGHLNARGHWLLSRQICAYLDEHKDTLLKTNYALHAD